jgi:hypothetical protein
VYTACGVKRRPEGAEIETSELLYFPRAPLEAPAVHRDRHCVRADRLLHRARAADNGQGILHTCDIEHRVEIDPRIADLPVVFHQKRGIDLINEQDYGINFCFIDSWWVDIRIEEMRAVVPKIAPGGLLCLHDPSQNYKWVYDKTVETVSWPNIVFHAPTV